MINWSDPIKLLEKHLEFEALLSNKIAIKRSVSQKGFGSLNNVSTNSPEPGDRMIKEA